MRGLLADADCVGHVMLLVSLMHDADRREYWEYLELGVFTLSDLGLSSRTSDRVIWNRCRDEDLLLITANRNADDADSLQNVIEEAADPDALPVITISNSVRVGRDREFAQRAADRLLRYLFDIDDYRGAQRLFIP
jgi:hypothetical protein